MGNNTLAGVLSLQQDGVQTVIWQRGWWGWGWKKLFSTEQPIPEFLDLSQRLEQGSGVEARPS